jgi:metal-responsive CopG/Arc/MetJ family transcriptional regulator
MPEIELALPDRINNQIDRFVEQGEFVNREQAFEDLLSMGVSAYDTAESTGLEAGEDLFTQATDDRRDPAALDDERDDDYTF